MKTALALVAAAAGTALANAPEPSYVTTRPPASTFEPSVSSILAAQATVVPTSPTSDVKGRGFDRIVQVWLENTDFQVSAGDPNMQWFASQGILLKNYFAVTHPSQPNYAASVAGDTFGMENDDYLTFPANISTVVDLLDTKGISWGEYQEHMPYAGYSGLNFSNQQTFANDYVRKHNPLIMFDNVANNATRVTQIKNFTSFATDLANKQLPQWSFITPNMSNDAHDTNITFAASWARGFLEPLLSNDYFMNNTLVILTFDECEDYPAPNRIYTVLMGGAIDKALHGTTDDMYYNHYSNLATVSANWELPSLGRWDCDANVFALVANKTGYTNSNITLNGMYFNTSYPGPVSDKEFTAGWWAAPDVHARCAAGLGVLPSVVSTWGNSTATYNYTNVYPYDANAGVNVAGTPVIGVHDRPTPPTPTIPGGAPTTPSPSSASTTPAKPNAAGVAQPQALAGLAVLGLVAAFL